MAQVSVSEWREYLEDMSKRQFKTAAAAHTRSKVLRSVGEGTFGIYPKFEYFLQAVKLGKINIWKRDDNMGSAYYIELTIKDRRFMFVK